MKLFLLPALILLGAALCAGQQSPHGDLSIPCQDCHTTTSWQMRADAKFDHASTGFPLVGQHRFLECTSCHAALVFAGTKKNCLTCHTDIHNSELGQDCMRCHTMTSWTVPDMRQKHQQTRFPLVGRHLDADCESCHENATPRRFASTSTECISCHRTEYMATMEPSHAAEGFPVDCANCHKVTSPVWKGSFDHDVTSFPLTGAHKAVACSECHTGNRFGKLPTDCYSCHQTDFMTVASPNHAAGGFSHACLSCHTTAAWKPATFDHNSTGFPLTGKHATTPCEDCHTNGNYQLAYANCYQCHQADYTSAVNPDHQAGGYDHNCLLCHSTAGWTPATFDHSSTRFALTGKHATTPCADCHTGGNYQLSYTDCYQCHQTDFASVTDPNHVAANFGHDCTPCHTTTAWLPSTFDHDGQYFRIYSGRHRGTWPGCATCHDAPADYAVFTCISCHEHDQGNTDGHHSGVGNYIYSRVSCYSCHRNV
jgi:hypothetical protein